jgi:putative serine protease PepD
MLKALSSLATIALVLIATRARALDLPELAARARPSVVLLTIKDQAGNPFATGSGFFASRGRVVTNYHVIAGASAVVATFDDRSEVPVRGVLASDAALDLAVLAVDSDASPLVLGDSHDVRVGDEIVILGSPHGLAGTLSTGIVSAIREKGVKDDKTNEHEKAWGVQVTAAVSPGSSGSPIMNREGRVVAVAVGIVGMHEGAQSLNFGIPAQAAKKLMEEIAPGATPTSFTSLTTGDRKRNLAISGAAAVASVLAYVIWTRIERRRRRPPPPALH